MIGTTGEPICPEPRLWHEIYERLTKAANESPTELSPPPRPLILGGWWGSSDLEKQSRWKETVDWAERWGLSDLIGEIPDEQMHKVDLAMLLLPLLSINPYPNRNYTARPRLPRNEVERVMEVLRSKWSEISGDLAECTRPLRLSGAKCRRLVVQADQKMKPPWGEWDRILRPNAPQFTKFRRAVNEAIAPHEVDHIEFI